MIRINDYELLLIQMQHGSVPVLFIPNMLQNNGNMSVSPKSD